MHPKIVESFWTDLDFEPFEGRALADHRLTFLWTFGGPVTNAAGIFPLNRRAFTGDTGLPFEQLEATMTAFPRAFAYDPASRHALVRNYIRHQFGVGSKLATNNFTRNIITALQKAPEVLALEVLRLYPELLDWKGFTHSGQALPKPFSLVSAPRGTAETGSPSEALPKPFPRAAARSGSRSESISTSQGSAEGGGSEAAVPSLDEVVAKAQMLAIPAEHVPAVSQDFWNWHDSRGWMSGNTPMRRPLNLLQSYYYTWRDRQKKNGGPQSGRPDTTGLNADELRARLATTRDPQERARLEGQLRAQP
jgi:hypothetical protein